MIGPKQQLWQLLKILQHIHVSDLCQEHQKPITSDISLEVGKHIQLIFLFSLSETLKICLDDCVLDISTYSLILLYHYLTAKFIFFQTFPESKCFLNN